MMPKESAREKTAKRESTGERQKGFWMVGWSDFFGADGLISLPIFEVKKVEFVVYKDRNQGTYYQPSLYFLKFENHTQPIKTVKMSLSVLANDMMIVTFSRFYSLIP